MDPTNGTVTGIASLPSPHAIYFEGGLVILLATFLWWATSAWIAGFSRRKGRTWASFFWIGIFLSPLISGTITASVTEAYHSDETVECPTCAAKIRFRASKCGSCGQVLTPNSEVGQDIVNRAAKWNLWFKWVPLVVTALGALWVLIGLVQDDAHLLQGIGGLMLGWTVLGIGAALWVVRWLRNRLADDLYFELVGD